MRIAGDSLDESGGVEHPEPPGCHRIGNRNGGGQPIRLHAVARDDIGLARMIQWFAGPGIDDVRIPDPVYHYELLARP